MAEHVNFTKASLEHIVSGHNGQRKMIHDTKQPGLAAELRGAGVLTFYLYKWLDGRPQKIRLGRFPETTIDQARQQTIKYLGEYANGHNPAAERRRARVEHVLGDLFNHWIESHAKLHRRSWPKDKARFDRYCSTLRTRRLSSISRMELQQFHAKLGRTSGPIMANRVLQLLSAVFNKAADIGYQGPNPCEKIKRFQEQERDRFLQPDELPAFWASLSHESQINQDFFLIVLLTGARRGNVQGMRWEDVNLTRAIWRIPHTKNDKPVFVHLPAKVVEILHRRHEENGSSEWVFPSYGETGHINKPTAAWKRIITRAGLDDLRIHDLRRTLGSWLAIGGASLPVVGKALGHTSTASTKIYARLTMAPVVVEVDKATSAILAAAQPKLKTKRKRVAK